MSFFIENRVVYAHSVQGALSAGRGWLVGTALLWTFAGPAWAMNECGTGLAVSCNGSGSSAGQKNPYANGIGYSGTDISLTLTGRVAVDTSGAAESIGPYTAVSYTHLTLPTICSV